MTPFVREVHPYSVSCISEQIYFECIERLETCPSSICSRDMFLDSANGNKRANADSEILKVYRETVARRTM